MKLIKFLSVAVILLSAAIMAAAQTVNCGCEAGPVPPVWATVNGVNITELDPGTVNRVKSLQQQVIDARARELDLQLNSKLLNLEAAKLKTTTTELIESEVKAKVKPPTAAEIEAFYNANRSKIEAQTGRTFTLAEATEEIRAYLLEQAEQVAAKVYADKLRADHSAKKLVDKATVPTTAAERQKVLATVGAVSIRSADIEDALKPLIYSAQRSVYTERKNGIDLMVNDKLIEAEAKKRGLTVKQVYDADIASKTMPVTDEQAQAFYNENKSRLNGEFATLKPQIVQYLNEQATLKADAAFADKLRAGAQIKYFLTEPVAPTYDIPAVGHGTKGAATAKVTLTVFTDYQCPTCALAHPDLQRILTEYPGKVRLVVYNNPLQMHADASKAAEAAEAAREQGKFWEYAELLYKNQSQLSIAKLKEYASTVGLDRAKFDAALDSGKFRSLVAADLLKGESVGVSGTPTVYLNGKPIDAFRYAELKVAVDAALK